MYFCHDLIQDLVKMVKNCELKFWRSYSIYRPRDAPQFIKMRRSGREDVASDGIHADGCANSLTLPSDSGNKLMRFSSMRKDNKNASQRLLYTRTKKSVL